MMPNLTKIYRRRNDRLTYHFMEECSKFPIKEYTEESLPPNIQTVMICQTCKDLEKSNKEVI